MKEKGRRDLVWPKFVDEVVHVDEEDTKILYLLLSLHTHTHTHKAPTKHRAM